MKKVFVIIVTYKGKRWYDRCFNSLRESTIPVQTVVVDNSPGDEDAEYIKKHFPEVHVIKTNENLGFGRANNLGMRYALDNGCDYVFLLNQDTWIKPDTLSIMMPIVEQHPECGLFSPMHITADEKGLYIEIEDGSTDHGNSLLADCYFQSLQDIYYFKYINAAAWLLPRKTLETIGGFDPLYFVYGEDDNYLHRLQYHNLTIALIPKAQIIHDHQKGHNASEHDHAYRREQTRLTDYLNITKDISVNKLLIHYMCKILRYALLLNQKKLRFYKNEFRFLWKKRHFILKSRSVNMKKGPSWL